MTTPVSYDAETRQQSAAALVRQVNENEAQNLEIERRAIAADEIIDRLICALVNEGFKILEDGIAQRPGDIDVAYVGAHGFPGWLGGPMYFADTIGLERVLARVNEFRRRFGEAKRASAPLSEQWVADGNCLADWAAAQERSR